MQRARAIPDADFELARGTTAKPTSKSQSPKNPRETSWNARSINFPSASPMETGWKVDQKSMERVFHQISDDVPSAIPMETGWKVDGTCFPSSFHRLD